MKSLTEKEITFLKENFNLLPKYLICEKLKISLNILNRFVKDLQLVKVSFRDSIKERNCPECNQVIKYDNYSTFKAAEKFNRKCKKCVIKWREEYYMGENNPFYGKKHSEEFKNKLSNDREGLRISPDTEFKKGHTSTHNPNFREIWKEKYNEDIFLAKISDLKEKYSRASSGKNNPMYGKPSPMGSGNGWSGWYKGWFFRSLNELSYMINVIERFNLEWENGELNKYKIKYIDYKGTERNYFPDFIINKKYIVECKPKKLWGSISVVSKMDAAKKYCEDNNMVYKLVESRKLTFDDIKKLKEEKLISFTDKYNEKFSKFINKLNE